jgi:hypothetical protein
MKSIHYIIITTFLSLFATGCEVLDKEPLDIISDNIVWDDQSLVDSYLADLYFETDFMERRVPYDQTGVSFAMIASMGGEGRSYGGHHQPYIASTRPITASDLNSALDYWRYENIRNCNYLIEKLTNESSLDQDFREQRIAEARFLRAYMYFEMVIRFGGVPIIDYVQDINASESELFVSRDSEKEVYDFIISELEDLAQDLPDSYSASDKGRPTKWAAYALISRAALYAASIANYGNVQMNGLLGFPKSDATTYAQKSYNASKELIDNGPHSLYQVLEDPAENFQNLFLDETSANTEAIMVEVFDYSKNRGHTFSCRAMPHEFSGSWGSMYYLYDFVERFEFADGTPGNSITREQLEAQEWSADELFTNRDPRFRASVFYPESPWKGAKVYLHSGTYRDDSLYTAGVAEDGWPYKAQERNTTKSGFMVRKRTNPDVYPSGGYPGLFNDETDYIIFRLGEIYLNLAEAAFYLDQTSEALAALNTIRQRAGMPDKTEITEEILQNERMVELTWENHSFWDLRRWRIAEEVLNGVRMQGIKWFYNYDTKKYQVDLINAEGVERIFLDHYYYLPITISRTSENPNMDENPGY